MLQDTAKSFLHIEEIKGSEEYTTSHSHRHGEYEIIWFTKVEGEKNIVIDFVEYPIRAGRFYIIPADKFHNMDRNGVQGLVISLSREFYFAVTPSEVQNERSLFTINAILNQQHCQMCTTMIGLITEEYAGECRYELQEAYFKALFIHLSPYFKIHYKDDEDHQIVSRLIDLLETHFRDYREVSYYADAIGVTERRLNSISKSVTGKTIKQHINERLLIEIKRMLMDSKIPLKSICYSLGFNEMSYFCRYFKLKTGQTPEEYRIVHSS